MEITNQRIFKVGYFTSLLGTALVLLWIGIFKFTLTEAKAIEPLVNSHPLMSWSYKIFSSQMVSNIIGTIEIITAILLLLSPFISSIKKYASIGVIVTFVITLSFLITLNSWKYVDSVPITDFFILKDLIPLGVGIMLMGVSKKNNN